MKPSIVLLLFFMNFSILAQSEQNYADQQVILKFKESNALKLDFLQQLKVEELQKINQEIGVYEINKTGNKREGNTFLLKFNNTSFEVEEVIELYQKTGRFEYVEPNFIGTAGGKMLTVPNDALYGNRQWGLKNNGSFSLAPATAGADIDMEPAWDIETGDPNMIIAILDSGLRLNHPEFSGRIWVNSGEVIDGVDNDGNGFIDDVEAGWDFANADNDPTDDQGHGTNVAGIALATGNNNIGYAGVNWNSKIMVCKILNDQNNGYYSWFVEGIYYAVNNGAKVLNMSVGGSSYSSLLADAIQYAYDNDVVVVACMMNENNGATYYPAGLPETIAVGSTDPDDQRTSPFFWSGSSGSNYGDHIDVVAPGNFIYGLHHQSNTYYDSYWGGTSQATPLVAGLASLILAQNPALTVEDVRSIIINSAEDQVGDSTEDVPGWDPFYGSGRINAYSALNSMGISPNFQSDNSIVYPNPISINETLNIIGAPPGDYEVVFYDVLGKKCASFRTEALNEGIELKIPNLSPGLHLVKINNMQTKEIVVKKLMIH